MNTLPYNIPYKFNLIARNEGKIKSYDSCMDVRAWTHDVETRSEYLRAWIKRDMPLCIVPVSTLADFLKRMGCKNRGRLTPRCHPNCRSKVVLESICTSCHTIRQCFQNDPKYEKYFEEEELETSHWPCARCLEALKSIKMFWRVIMEKVFHIDYRKNEKVPLNRCSTNVQNVARTWQTDIVHEAVFTRTIVPFLKTDSVKTKYCQCNAGDCVTKTSGIFSTKDVASDSMYTLKKKDNLAKSEKSALSEGNRYKRRKVNRSVSVKVKKNNVSCEVISLNDGESGYKKDLNDLQRRFDEQKADVERLRKENLSLKIELQNAYNGLTMGPHECTAILPTQDALACLPKPYDYEPADHLRDVESEMIITMKNCRNSGYKQVSILQVLHKSNEPFYSGSPDAGCRNEDPINLLGKIQTTFGAMVQREVSLISDTKRNESPPSDINASYHTARVSESKLSNVTRTKLDKDVKN